ncbi:hypothetical protein RFI_31735, partial [Reticulomyxa filosa]
FFFFFFFFFFLKGIVVIVCFIQTNKQTNKQKAMNEDAKEEEEENKKETENEKEMDKEKVDKLVLLMEYLDKEIVDIQVDSQMGFASFVAVLAEALHIGSSNSLQDSIQITLICTTNVFNGKNYFRIYNASSWQLFWKQFAHVVTNVPTVRCVVNIKPEIIQVNCGSDGEAIVEFTKSGQMEKCEIEVKMVFDTGETDNYCCECTDSPFTLFLRGNQTVMDAFKTFPNSVTCHGVILSNILILNLTIIWPRGKIYCFIMIATLVVMPSFCYFFYLVRTLFYYYFFYIKKAALEGF